MKNRLAGMLGLSLCLFLAGCGEEELVNPTETGAGPLAAAQVVDDGQFLALTYNVHAVITEVPGGISDVIVAYIETVDRMARIGPLLNAYELAVLQENFVAQITINLGFFRLRIRLAGVYGALDDRAHHAFRSGYQTPQDPPMPPPVNLNVQVSDGLVRFSDLAFARQDLVRHSWDTCNGSDCFANKGFSVVRTRLSSAPGGVVDIYNLHMNSGNAPADLEARWEQMVQLSQTIEETSAGHAVIVAGDFNLDPFHADPVRAGRDAEILEELLDRTGLSDACTELTCCELPTPAMAPCDGTQIDRFLFRSAGAGSNRVVLQPVSWAAHGAGTPFEGLSDHSAIEVGFDWRLVQGAATTD